MNNYGQLGDGSTTNRRIPTRIGSDGLGLLDGRTAKQISVGQYHTCAIASDDTVYCWGWNSQGRLGDGTITDRRTPTRVGSDDFGLLDGNVAKQISVGYNHACATDFDDTVYCWGVNGFGQLGDGTFAYYRDVPALVYTSGLSAPTYTVTFDKGNEPAECVNVEVAADGQSLTCTTTAHSAGLVDVMVSNGISEAILVDGYEYIAPAPLDAVATNDNIHWLGEVQGKTYAVNKDYTDESEVSVYLDSELLSADKYTLTKGSTIVTLQSWFLNTLEIGTYTITISFTDGATAQGELLVKDRLATPNTGIGQVPAISGGIMGVVGVGVAIVLIAVKVGMKKK